MSYVVLGLDLRMPCTVTVVGDCKISECTLGDGGAIEPPLVGAYASAGTITFRGGNPETSFTADPKADGSYDAPHFTSNGRAFAGGESATLSATGGAVPAFTQALTYPLLFILEQPAIADGGSGTLTVPRTQDFTFAWSRGTADADVVLQGSSGASPATSVSLLCRFAAATGSATLPRSLLTRMNAGTTILVFSAGKVTTQAGPYTVTTYLAGEMLTPSKTAAVSLLLQ